MLFCCCCDMLLLLLLLLSCSRSTTVDESNENEDCTGTFVTTTRCCCCCCCCRCRRVSKVWWSFENNSSSCCITYSLFSNCAVKRMTLLLSFLRGHISSYRHDHCCVSRRELEWQLQFLRNNNNRLRYDSLLFKSPTTEANPVVSFVDTRRTITINRIVKTTTEVTVAILSL